MQPGSYKELFDSALLGVFRSTMDGYMLWGNDTLARIFGYSTIEEMRSYCDSDTTRIYLNLQERTAITQAIFSKGQVTEAEVQMVCKDGSTVWISLSGHAARDTQGTVLYFEGFLYSITSRKRMEQVSNALIRISNAVSVTNDLNDLFRSIHNILKDLLYAENFFIGLHDEKTDNLDLVYLEVPTIDNLAPISNISDPCTASLSGHVLRTGSPLLIDKKGQEKMGFTGIASAIWLGVPLIIREKTIGVMAVQHYEDPNFYNESHVKLMVSISEQVAMAIQRKRSEELLAYQATHDFLTGLPNRLLFTQRLEAVIKRKRRCKSTCFSVLMLDLDRFKLVNDSLGHHAGDELLRQVSARLAPCLREVDTIARFGGDEFAVLLENNGVSRDTMTVVERLEACLKAPFDLNGQLAHSAVSIGVVINTENYEHPEEIIRDADLAMYKAKENLKSNFCIFDSSLHEQAVKAITLENAMRKGLRNNEFHLVFQPIFDLETTTLSGFEALLRWESEELGSVYPDQFIPVAEDSGMIIELGAWTLKKACATMAEWFKDQPKAENVFMSVNLSPRQFAQADLPRMVKDTLEHTKLKGSSLRLEITESTIMRDVLSTNATLSALTELGVCIGIDDFGTGYSSLSYLQQYPVDILKIDRSFISELDTKAGNRRLIKSIIALSHSLNIHVVAEGVETRNQASILKNLHCEFGQGYFFSRPVPAETALQFISLGALPIY
ncbi:MAG: EAL domain-containing protein [Desulfovibrio sp.]|uniref:EAL domain-containing protein n=1 Tax=Desulfovibrio sp. 7SRBS1 TaxID=3378064 RepID=UPI003B3E7069